MADDFQESISSFNPWSSLRCSDIFSCSTAVNAGDIEETFGCFPATTDIFELSKANSFDYFTQPSSLDLLSSSIDWSQSFLESSETNSQAVLLEDRATTRQCQIQNNLTETSQDSSDMIIHGFFKSDQTLSESAMDELQILPTVKSSLFSSTSASNIGSLATSVISDPPAKSNITVSRESILPIAKKIRIEAPYPPTFKVRKEKLGDRITALQQLVSPFGKTDTASVLQEAIQYIKFLHEQVNGLSNPYLINGHQIRTNQQILETQTKNGDWAKKDLRSLGLCLVPISSTFTMARNELPPIDFWTQIWRMENCCSIRRER